MAKWTLPPTGGGLFGTSKPAKTKVYLLTRTERAPSYDVVNEFVVRAESETEARALAASQCMDEGSGMWLDPKSSAIEVLTHAGESGVIVRSSVNG